MAPGAAAAAAVAARGAANGSSQSFEPVQCRAVYPFAPRMDDEIQLTPGDVLLLLKIFDDGWAVANNLTTGLEGAVPLVCVMPYHPDDAVDGDGAASTFGNKEGGSMAAIAQSPPLRDRGGSNGAHMAEKMAASPRSTTTRSQLHSARSTDAFGSRSFPDDSFNAAEIERSLSSLNASAAAIAATLSAATGSHTSSMMSPRASGTVHDSQLPRRHSSRTSTQPLRSLVNDNHHP
ncbi:hypothetical protein H4R34_005372 [Dimargaris verticillata]|uniref:SH3 domain-containing protein n=1 Tax=Dimargaris verticillata TaxID=2761393 RepID=A0A9W8E690_9FUNG|nr:hypothetical protein H4R34_005372 [Dimargaris verticillata]